MLSPEDRRLYSNLFTKPEGYRFDIGLGTTFCLDLEMLLFAAVACSYDYVEDPDAALADQSALLRGALDVGKRLTVFHQDGQLGASGFSHSIFSLLEEACVPVNAPTAAGIFHPKLWLLRFKSEQDDSVMLRVVVLSRNMSQSRAWDTIVQVQASPYPKATVGASKPLASLLRYLRDSVAAPFELTQTQRDQLELLTSEIERTHFEAPAPFESLEFLTIGIAKRSKEKAKWNPEPGKRMLGISPFLSDDALVEFGKKSEDRQLISRIEAMDTCRAESLEGWTCSSLADDATPSTDIEADDDPGPMEWSPSGLHAKALIVENGPDTTWWLGSANLTDAVWKGENTELLVRLGGKTKKVGIDALLDGNGTTGLRQLLQPYVRPDAPEQATARDKAVKLLNTAQRSVAQTKLKGTCMFESANSSWTIRLAEDGSKISGLDPQVRLGVNLLTLPVGHTTSWRAEGVEFRGLATETLTAFVVFVATVRIDDVEVIRSFTRKVFMEGLPSDRDQRIVASVLRDRKTLFAFIETCLADIDGNPFAGPSIGKKRRGNGAGATAATNPVILESLLRALRRTPERLVALDRALNQVSQDASDRWELPEDLAALWQTIRAVVPGLSVTTAPNAGTHTVGTDRV